MGHSRPARVKIVPPGWFTSLATPGLQPVDVTVPGGLVRLVPLPGSEIGERWSEARRLIALLLLSSLLSAAFCVATMEMSLRRLRALAGAFQTIEEGRPSGPLSEAGPPEIAHLAASFNRMQAALARADAENRRLSGQLERLADEERSELARDLHDEVGPLLFALSAWATAAEMQQRNGDREAGVGVSAVVAKCGGSAAGCDARHATTAARQCAGATAARRIDRGTARVLARRTPGDGVFRRDRR